MERFINKHTGVILTPTDEGVAQMLAHSEDYAPYIAPPPPELDKGKGKKKEE